MKAKTQPFSLAPTESPLSGSIEVNRMNVPCIIVKPTRNRKFTLTSAEMFGSPNRRDACGSRPVGNDLQTLVDSCGRLSRA